MDSAAAKKSAQRECSDVQHLERKKCKFFHNIFMKPLHKDFATDEEEKPIMTLPLP